MVYLWDLKKILGVFMGEVKSYGVVMVLSKAFKSKDRGLESRLSPLSFRNAKLMTLCEITFETYFF